MHCAGSALLGRSVMPTEVRQLESGDGRMPLKLSGLHYVRQV